MPVKSFYYKKGNTLESRLGFAISEATYAALISIGDEVTDYFKSEIRKLARGGSGQLADSFTYATMAPELPNYSISKGGSLGNPVFGKIGPAAEDDDVISPVTSKFTVKIGSAARHARYFNDGSGPHINGSDGAGFWERIQEWGERLGMAPHEIQLVAKNIKERGTEPNPYFEGGVQLAKRESKRIIDAWNLVAKNLKPIKVEITANGEKRS